MSRFGNVLKSFARQIPVVGSVFNNVELLSNLFGKGDEFDETTGNVFNQLAKGADNYMRAALHTGLTDEELQRNALMRENRQTAMSDEVKGLEAAGLNAGLVYGSSPSVGNPQSMPGNSGAGLSDLLALAMLPAQIRKINAEAGLVEQKTSTEEQITAIQTVLASYQIQLSEAEISELLANIRNKDADTKLKTSQTDLVKNEADAIAITNQYLDEKTRVEIDNLKKTGENISQMTALKKAETIYQNWYNNFCQKNNFLPSSNDTLLIATYVASLFGIAKDDVDSFIQRMIDGVKRPFVGKNINKGGSR